MVGLTLLDEKKRYHLKTLVAISKKKIKGIKHENGKEDEIILTNMFTHVHSFCLVFSLFSLLMQGLRVASLNINGGRDAKKRAFLSEQIQQNRLDVVFLGF